MTDKMNLLIDGKNAFPRIIECIRQAEKSIYINMFIWRDDKIGNIIAEEIYKAAERGVQVFISKDTYGTVCEHSEESGTSFFHKKISFTEKVKILVIRLMYNLEMDKNPKDKESDIYKKIINHKKINLQADIFKADHSKYYIFDDKILILGGINIEDKENGCDMRGRIYQDYMIELDGEKYVKQFNQTLESGIDCLGEKGNIYFGINKKSKEKNIFQVRKLYLDLINAAEKNLTIVMAYFSPLTDFVEAIMNAKKRGVNVKIVIPQSANVQESLNKKTVRILLKKSKKIKSGSFKLYFSPKMLHTKLIFSEKTISFGSCNITKKAFKQLNELNFFAETTNKLLEKQLVESVENTISGSKDIFDEKKIKYNKFKALLEQTQM